MLQEATYAQTQRAFEGRSADDRLMVKFEMFPHPDERASVEAGHPVFKDTEYVTIIVPGDKTTTVHRPVWAQDKERFARQYQAFVAGKSQEVSGLPLRMWGGLTLSQAKEFEYFNVKTVEQLAEMSDGNGVSIHGFHALKQRAQDYIKSTKEQQPLLQMRAELEERDNTIETMQMQQSQLIERMAAMEKLISPSKLKLLEQAED